MWITGVGVLFKKLAFSWSMNIGLLQGTSWQLDLQVTLGERAEKAFRDNCRRACCAKNR